MKKALSIVLAVALLAVAPLLMGVTADAASPVHGKISSKLVMTDEQKAKMISLKTQILELKKEIVKQNVADGNITPEQGQKLEKKIDAKLKALQSGELGHSRRNHSPEKR